MTTTISVADLKRPVTVELRQDDPNEWFVYLFDRAGDEIANFGISTPASLAIAEQTRDAINRYPGLVAALHRLLDFSDHKSWCWYIQADELARAQTRCNCWFRAAQDAAQSALTGSGHVFMSEDEAEFIASRVNHHAALVAARDGLISTLRDLWSLALVQPEFTGFCDEVVVRSRRAIDMALAGTPTQSHATTASLEHACRHTINTLQTLLDHPEPTIVLDDWLRSTVEMLDSVLADATALPPTTNALAVLRRWFDLFAPLSPPAESEGARLLIETALVLDGSMVPPQEDT